MLFKNNRARRGLALLASAGIASSLLVTGVSPASAATVEHVLTFDDGDVYGPLAVGKADDTDWDGSFGDYAGGSPSMTTIATPSVSNSSGKALQIKKTSANEAWAGVNLFQAPTGEAFTDSTHKTISFDFYSPDSSNIPLMFKLIDDTNYALVKTFTAEPGWKNYSIDVSTISGEGTSGAYSADKTWVKIAILPNFTDFAVTGVSAVERTGQEYYIDNFTITGVTVTPPAPLTRTARVLSFEDSDIYGDLAVGESGSKWAGFFGGAGTGRQLPSVAHTGKALEFNKAAAGEVWSGINLWEAPEGEAFTDSTYKTVTFDYYSPVSTNTPILLKLVKKDDSAVLKSVAALPGWHTYTVDWSTVDGTIPEAGTWSGTAEYIKLVMIPDFTESYVPAAGATAVEKNGQLFYIDNVAVNGWGKAKRVSAGTVSGTAKVGKTLTATTGTWTGRDVVKTYRWYRCSVIGRTTRLSSPTSADKCSVISGKTARTYKLTSSDKNKYIRVRVTATTPAGSVYSTSKSTAKVG